MKLFSGVDLAADPAKTGVATIEERGTGSGGRGLRVAHAELGADDDAVGDLVAGSTLTGIDVPVGWPRGFREVVEKHAEGALEAPSNSGLDVHRAGRCLPPPAENEELAALIAEEGWIWVSSA